MSSTIVTRRALLAGSAALGIAVAAPWVRRAHAAVEKIRMASWSPRLAEQANIYVS